MTDSPKSLLDQRITEREHEEFNRGLLSQLVFSSTHLFSNADQQSLQHLKEARASATSGQQVDAQRLLREDDQATNWRDTVTTFTAGIAKAVPLFLGKGKGYFLSAGLNAADQVRVESSPEMMAVDFALGAAKGTALKFGVDKFNGSAMSMWKRGGALGGALSFSDSALTSSTWYDAQSGKFNLGAGAEKVAESSAVGAASGALAFPASAKLAETLYGSTQKAGLVFSRVVAGAVTGWSFGFVSGVAGETSDELTSRKSFDPLKVLQRGLTCGSMDMFAGVIGKRLGARNFPAESIPPIADETVSVTSNAERPATLAVHDAANLHIEPVASDVSATQQVRNAVDATKEHAGDYFDKTLKQRTTDAMGSRYENISPDQLEQAIRNTEWQPYDHPAIKPPAVAFRGNLPGRLGMIDVDQIPQDTPLWLMDPKGTGAFSLATKGVAGPEVDFSTLIVGPNEGHDIVYTIHPGDPVSPSPVTNLPPDILSRRLPGAETRIPVSRKEAQDLGLTTAKIETE